MVSGVFCDVLGILKYWECLYGVGPSTNHLLWGCSLLLDYLLLPEGSYAFASATFLKGFVLVDEFCRLIRFYYLLVVTLFVSAMLTNAN
jgi:hypothetical protein